jgi:hypothetical protein
MAPPPPAAVTDTQMLVPLMQRADTTVDANSSSMESQCYVAHGYYFFTTSVSISSISLYTGWYLPPAVVISAEPSKSEPERASLL